MKIAFILPSLKPTAPILVAQDIIAGLRKCHPNVDVTVFYLKQSDLQVTFNVPTVKISFFKAIDFSNYDIVHSHMFKPDFYIFLHSMFKQKKTRFVSTLHSLFLEDLYDHYGYIKSRIFGLVWALSWSKFDRLAVLSHTSKTYYSKVLPFFEYKLSIINNGRDVDSSLIQNCSNDDVSCKIKALKNDKNIVIGTCCIVRELKGLELVIYALAKNDSFDFVLIGDGPYLEYLIELSVKLGVRERFHTLGRIENAYVYVSLFDIYVMPSISEGFGLALLEAAAQKSNIVTSNIEIFKEIFPNEVTFFELGNVDSLVSAIGTSYKKDLGDDVYMKYKENYTVDVMSNNYYDLYITMMNNK
ncbi:glycosyltransferase family 4 protein [Photobacterium swingsii]|uniref:glycosyltransferase family 4 protein n=1 Tax=Photobacterium swingsii TaxID=680026 RepID=UPI0021C342F2|nr:glycosyltransferase family 4 protein [Photobacterium swingsii]